MVGAGQGTSGDAGQPIVARVAGFVNHLRLNGFPLGPRETELALSVLDRATFADVQKSQLALKTGLCGDHDQWNRFDALFEAYWFGRGRVSRQVESSNHIHTSRRSRPDIWDTAANIGKGGEASGSLPPSNDNQDDSEGKAHQRLIATGQNRLAKTDLRYVVDPDEIRNAERLAVRLASALRFARSRRRRAARNGNRLDLRRIIRRSLSHGGEPIDLVHRRPPQRPVRVVVLLDVSGSMQQYSRFFLQFIRGLIDRWMEAEAFIFHTRLLNVSDALRENDPFRAMSRLSLMTEGFGGGTKIAGSLRTFNNHHAARALNSRSVVVILSDGYDTDEPEDLTHELIRLRRKARRIVWLNPLLGWRDYEPVSRAMTAAMPHIDCFAPASTLEELAAVEPILARL